MKYDLLLLLAVGLSTAGLNVHLVYLPVLQIVQERCDNEVKLYKTEGVKEMINVKKELLAGE